MPPSKPTANVQRERSSVRDPAATAAPVLELSGVHVSYGSAAVLQGLDLRVRPGEMVGLAGRNGAGKTTTLRTVSGMVTASAGTIASSGRALPRHPERVVAAGVAHVPEGRHVFASLTVLENLRAAAYGARRELPEAMLARVMELFPALERLLQRKAGFLSGGEQQMVAIARGIVAQPKLLMIDEVSLGLAPRLVGDMWRALDALRSDDLAMLVVDQNVRIMAAHCDRIYLLDDGVAHEASLDGAGEDEVRALYFD